MKKENKKPRGSTLALAVILVMAVSASIEENPAEPYQSPHPECSDGIDNDMDGLTDYDDPQCTDESNFGGEAPDPTVP